MNDLRRAVRALRATPAVTAVVILSLALGIGANTAIFSLVNGLLLRGLPVRNADRLVTLTVGNTLQRFTYATFEEIRRHEHLFDGALAWAESKCEPTGARCASRPGPPGSSYGDERRVSGG